MEKSLEKIADATLRGIGMICLLLAVASPIIALVTWRGYIVFEGLIGLFLYFAFIDTANKFKELNETMKKEEILDSAPIEEE